MVLAVTSQLPWQDGRDDFQTVDNGWAKLVEVWILAETRGCRLEVASEPSQAAHRKKRTVSRGQRSWH